MKRSLYSLLMLLICLPTLAGSPVRSQAQANALTYYIVDPTSAQYQVWVAQPDGAGAHNVSTALLEATNPVWSRDGQHIAVTGNDGTQSSNNVYVFDRNGNNMQEWTDNKDVHNDDGSLQTSYGAEFKAFSPDGQHIILSQGGYGPTIVTYLEVFNSDGTYASIASRPCQGAEDGWGVDWSPVANQIVTGITTSGSNYAYVTPLYLIAPVANAIANGQYVQLTDPQSPSVWTTVNDELPVFSPDGKQVAFIRKSATYTANGFGPATTDLMVVNVDGSGLREVAEMPQGTVVSYHLSWSPDGTQLVFDVGNEIVTGAGYMGIAYPSQTQLATIHLDGTGYTVLPIARGAAPSWNPGAGAAAAAPRLLFQNPNTGQLAQWNMNGTTPNGANFINPTQNPLWKAVGMGDFNGDGQQDLLFQNQNTGQLALWYMNGDTANGGLLLSQTPPAGWKVASVNDFNGDGQPDVLLVNPASGQMAFWYMNGAKAVGGAFLNKSLPAGWNLVGTGDFNGDGKPDLLLQNGTTGQLAAWFLNGTTVAGGTFMTPTQTSAWKAVSVQDLNGDGKPDILFQNTTTGQLAYWLMNGTQAADGNLISPTPPAGWQLVGPH